MKIEDMDAWLNCKPLPSLKICKEDVSVQELVSRDIINKGIMEFKNNLNEPSIDKSSIEPLEKTFGPQRAQLKPIEIEYIQWHDNLSEMKRFCQDDCKIEYITTHIDDFWHLSVNDCLTHMWGGAAIGDYVVKLPEGYTVVSSRDFKKYFENEN